MCSKFLDEVKGSRGKEPSNPGKESLKAMLAREDPEEVLETPPKPLQKPVEEKVPMFAPPGGQITAYEYLGMGPEQIRRIAEECMKLGPLRGERGPAPDMYGQAIRSKGMKISDLEHQAFDIFTQAKTAHIVPYDCPSPTQLVRATIQKWWDEHGRELQEMLGQN